jgi:hypothetical protein
VATNANRGFVGSLGPLPLRHATVVLRERREYRPLVVSNAVVFSHGERGLRPLTPKSRIEVADSFDMRAVVTDQDDVVPVPADRIHSLHRIRPTTLEPWTSVYR